MLFLFVVWAQRGGGGEEGGFIFFENIFFYKPIYINFKDKLIYQITQ